MRMRLGLVLVVGLLLGFVAGCGGPEKLTSKTLFPAVSKAQAAAGSSHLSMQLTAPTGQTFRSHGEMKLGKHAEDTAMVMTVAGQGSGLGTIELRLVDRNFYMALGALTKGKFAKFDLTDQSNPVSRQYGEIIKNVDPARQMASYQDAITSFDSSGKTVELDGVKTQPYAITIDPKKAGTLKSFGANGQLPKKIRFTLYLGPDNLPRRMVSLVPGSAGDTRLQMDYTKWGEKVSIKAPSKSDIVDDSLFSQLGKAS
ncbi:MAG: hypothetical protein ACJ71Z_11565 [Aeromicrobium sp.]